MLSSLIFIKFKQLLSEHKESILLKSPLGVAYLLVYLFKLSIYPFSNYPTGATLWQNYLDLYLTIPKTPIILE